MSMQQRILTMLRDTASTYGMDFVVQAEYGNTGTVYVQRKDRFETVVSFAYNFQGQYMTLQAYPAGIKPYALIGGVPKDCIGDFYCHYHDDARMQELFAWFTSSCAGRPTKGGRAR